MFIESGLTAASGLTVAALTSSTAQVTKVASTLPKGRSPNIPATTSNVPLHLAENSQQRHPWLKPSSIITKSDSLKSGLSGQRDRDGTRRANQNKTPKA